ncbi:hypothetical protein [Cellulomonas sp. SLBN-39]|uniref:hypothetical protein n=1 Tax=Cellulomonas sp. SLBN-39 TaxID=2768446 RepID=UPI00115092D2|nr:hypothetical protein [Cellulomonas sp. SLBN-39]TQL04631.1 hypothetical protein FBY24_3752 [Cellulomonas sp. SLBN-39]
MSDLDLDTAALRRAGAALADVARAFAGANVTARDLRDVLGHDGLADALGGFALGWDDARALLVTDVEALADACTRVGEAFEDVDARLAGAGGPRATPGPAGSGRAV